MTTEKRPQDGTVEEQLKRVITCGDRDEESVNQLCREQGIYPHHLAQWQTDFVEGKSQADKGASRADTRQLKQENKSLKKALNKEGRRKEKALAETAALLVLQKKGPRSGEATRTTHNEPGTGGHFAADNRRGQNGGRTAIGGL